MKRLLVIATAFAPENAIGAVRTTKLVKYFVRMGWNITVISPKLSEDIKKDNSLICDELDEVKKINIPYGRFFSNYIYKKRNKVVGNNSASSFIKSTGHSRLSKVKAYLTKRTLFIYTLIRNFSWKRQVKKYIDENFKENEFDYIFSSYPSVSSHLAAKYALKKKIAKKWIADFRDPMAYEGLHSSFESFVYNWIQKGICDEATLVTAVSKGLEKELSDRYEIPQKCFYLPNGFDEDDLKPLKKSENFGFPGDEYFNIVYAGSLYSGKRDLRPLFGAIRSLCENTVIDKHKVKFIYAGRDFSELRLQATDFGLEEILENKGFISRVEALNLQNSSNLVIVSTWNSEYYRGVVPGKIYEAFLLKKPVLAFVDGPVEGSELKEMIDSYGIGFTYESANSSNYHFQSLVEFVEALYSNRQLNIHQPKGLNIDFTHSFEYSRIAKELENIMTKPI